MNNINLTPKIIKDDNVLKIILSNDFQKLYDAEVNYIDYIMNCYFEDPIHCRIFEFNDVYQFNKELADIIDTFLYKQLNSITIEAIKIKVMDLCNRFISGYMRAKSIDYYSIWNNL